MIVRCLTVVFLGVIVMLVCLADRASLPKALLNMKSMPLGDKIGHFVLMGTLALLMNASLGARRIQLGGMPVLLGSVIVLGLVTAEEISQLWFPARSFEIVDLAADLLGIALLGPMGAKLC